MSRHNRGFTLIELLVALAIFGVLSVLSLRAISGALDHRAHIEDETRKWRDLGRLYAVIEADLGAALAGPGTSFEGGSTPAPQDGGWLAFARAGSAEAQAAAIAPRAVRYRLADGHVERRTYALSGADTALVASRYPARVRALALRYLGANGEWSATWPESTSDLPRAIELDLELASRERVRRVLLVR